MKTILVTGGAGFIGANFILYWLNKYPSDKIINLDKLTYASNLKSLENISNNPNYTFIKGDICDSNLVDTLVKKVDLIVHFAAETHVDNSISDPTPFITSNILGTFTLLQSAKKYNKRFHHISTDEVFGQLQLDDKNIFGINTPYNPRSPYSASKASSDHLVRSFFFTYNLPITISNCSNNFGPYQHPERFIPNAITNLLLDKKIPIYGDGLYCRDWLYVIDHCVAIDLILNKGKIGQSYLIGGLTEDITNLEIAKMLINICEKNESYIEFVSDRPGHDRRYAIDWFITKQELGYEPVYSFKDYLSNTVNWYKKNKAWWINLKK